MFTWRTLAQVVCAGVLLGLLLIACLVTIPRVEVAPPVPACQEDQLILGAGDYAGGYWTVYTCINLEGI